MTSQLAERTHPVAAFAARAGARLDELTVTPVWSMTPEEQREALVALTRLETQVAALRLAVLAEADRSGATVAQAAGSAADYLAVETRQTHRAARADLRLGEALETRTHLAAGIAAGRVNVAQARVIVTALDRLPRTGTHAVTPEQVGRAEEHLVGLAAHHDPVELTRLGRRLFEVVAPEVADLIEGRALEAEEAAALARTTFTMRADDEGTVHGRFRIPALHGQMLHTMLLALTDPTTPTTSAHSTTTDADAAGSGGTTGGTTGDATTEAVGAGSAASHPQRHPAPVARGLAFCDLIERIPADTLPTQGGVSATVVVTMTLEQLLGGVGAAGLDTGLETGGDLSAAQARRLACTAGIVPAVLGGASQVLDLGRRRRFHTEPQRLALALTQGGCTAEGCDKPPALCHAHHDHPWSHGGATDLTNGRLLCGHHHRRIHDPAYDHRLTDRGKVTFHRRT